ncbi:methyltransferase family protein [Saccharopolyspora erythraea NRRL 2338]|uniref:Methyltransferase n=2 Tax=Saccharopolyspora erythraea TaxID=1836 RepID=A4FEH3_SACEN|nr:class I SAM-dependent methyltransferase [Saccharopolyspora erythraea]EQD83016.1 SAM-dependent methyltransferase [Saccharopolyspora erythraea D]PFG96174.1 methyltransferase family protein [Saccharopolyspora erythraea NRRL 2338]QRK92707.1 methyltransferase domain-containing protein [Saccharopolyspora erythraea]CAM02448.1 putative methyltransferase [Saccharopolyspora erythraea NRRL 2338]
MSTSGYGASALSKDLPGERERLGSIQSSVDEFSTAVIRGLGLAPDWRCLELGAGAGSIARWLARHCPEGHVEAVDNDVRYLDAGDAANLTVTEADVTAEGFEPGRFDLVHARFLFCHLPERDELLARAVRWLRPGGWLVITDPYQLPADTSPFPVVERIMAAYKRNFERHGADLTWARGLPALLGSNGLGSIGFTGKPACMGNLEQDRWRPLIAKVASALVADGGIDRSDLEEFERLLAEPGFVDIPQFTLAAWGRAPGAP